MPPIYVASRAHKARSAHQGFLFLSAVMFAARELKHLFDITQPCSQILTGILALLKAGLLAQKTARFVAIIP